MSYTTSITPKHSNPNMLTLMRYVLDDNTGKWKIEEYQKHVNDLTPPEKRLLKLQAESTRLHSENYKQTKALATAKENLALLNAIQGTRKFGVKTLLETLKDLRKSITANIETLVSGHIADLLGVEDGAFGRKSLRKDGLFRQLVSSQLNAVWVEEAPHYEALVRKHIEATCRIPETTAEDRNGRPYSRERDKDTLLRATQDAYDNQLRRLAADLCDKVAKERVQADLAAMLDAWDPKDNSIPMPEELSPGAARVLRQLIPLAELLGEKE